MFKTKEQRKMAFAYGLHVLLLAMLVNAVFMLNQNASFEMPQLIATISYIVVIATTGLYFLMILAFIANTLINRWIERGDD